MNQVRRPNRRPSAAFTLARTQAVQPRLSGPGRGCDTEMFRGSAEVSNIIPRLPRMNGTISGGSGSGGGGFGAGLPRKPGVSELTSTELHPASMMAAPANNPIRTMLCLMAKPAFLHDQ